MYSKVIQLYIHMYLFFFRFFPHLGYYRILSKNSLCCTAGPCWCSILNIVSFTFFVRDFGYCGFAQRAGSTKYSCSLPKP